MIGDDDKAVLHKIWREVDKVYEDLEDKPDEIYDGKGKRDEMGIVPKVVAEGLLNWVKSYRDYHDSVLCILEAPIAFPSGFYF